MKKRLIIVLAAVALLVGFVGLSLAGLINFSNVSDHAVAAISIAPAPVPEPAIMLLLGTGLVGISGSIRRRKKKK